ncbi:MAG: glutaredoxin family protein [Rubrobacteridae bacterium]|nr:glutaredoxin family protein [Rubrobacteridae bacterium]
MAYSQHIEKVDGTKKSKVFLFALSTCGWCKKTKSLLNELGVEYEYVDVDLLSGVDRDEAKTAMSACNPHQSFPTISIDDGRKCIVGFAEDEIRDVLR